MRSGFAKKGLMENRGAIKAEIEKLQQQCEAENRAMNDDERKRFNKLKSDWDIAGEQIRQLEGDEERNLGKLRKSPGKHDVSGEGTPTGRDEDGDADFEATRAVAFQGWVRSASSLDLTESHRSAMFRMGVTSGDREFVFRLRDESQQQQRALGKGTNSLGGYTVPQSFSDALEKALQDFSHVRGVTESLVTDHGRDIPWPIVDDTDQSGAMISEGEEVLYADTTFSSVTLGAFKFTSKMFVISHELLQDAAEAIDLAREIGQLCGERIGRAQGPYLTTGTGTNQPHGVVTMSGLGVTAASATAFTADELTRLAFSVDPAYRNGPKVGYMMKDDVIGYALSLKDSQNRPLLRESYRDGIRELILNGFPVWPNQFMTGLTNALPSSGSKHVLFGDFSRVKTRDAGELRVKRLDERYAEKDQVGFVAFLRSDQRCVRTAAIKHLLQA